MEMLFGQILGFDNPADPKALWERLKNLLAEIFFGMRQNNLSENLMAECTYCIIVSKLNTKVFRSFSFWLKRCGMDNTDTNENNQGLKSLNSRESAATGDF